jgi:hypothetical protein
MSASSRNAWERTGVVGDREERTVSQTINGAVKRRAHHLKFIVERRRRIFGNQSRTGTFHLRVTSSRRP